MHFGRRRRVVVQAVLLPLLLGLAELLPDFSRTESAGRCAGVAGSAIFLPEISLYGVPMRSLKMAMAPVPGSGAQSL